jgi:hypothetical protein
MDFSGVSFALTQEDLVRALDQALVQLRDAGLATGRLAGLARLLRTARVHPGSLDRVRAMAELELARVLLAGTGDRARRPSGAGTK